MNEELGREAGLARPRSAAEMGNEPEEQGERDAEEYRGDEREIERRVFAAMNDIAGEATEAEREFAAEIKKSADKYEEGAEDEEGAAEFAEGIHEGEFRRSEGKK